ncbi:hypothetical protein [Mariluticola halotolerans]|nr:hypothetical protein [Mariluticola halotolerans]
MTESKNFFRNVFDAMIESRSRQAARELAQHRELFKLNNGTDDKR